VANIRTGGRLKRAAATRPSDIDFSAAISAKTEWACLLVAATRGSIVPLCQHPTLPFFTPRLPHRASLDVSTLPSTECPS